MAEIDPLTLKVVADTTSARAEVRDFQRSSGADLNRVERDVVRLERQFHQSSSAISGTLKQLAGTFATAFSVREIVRMADTWSDLQSQVGVAVKDMQAGPALMGRIAEAARASYSPLEQTATQFARNARTLDQMGYSTDQALQFTEALNNALVATATRGDRARQVQDSLSKAIATGNLEAEGLENILAHGGAVAEALAKHLNVTTNQLYALRKEGRLTGDVLVQSLINNFDELRAQAETMPATVGDGFTLLRNELMRYLGETDQALGASERMAQAIINLSDNMDVLVPAVALVAAGLGVGYVSSAVAATAAATGLGASAAKTGRTMLAAFGGPVGIAITAVAGSLYYFAARGAEAEAAMLATARAAEELGLELSEAQKAALAAADETAGMGDDAARAEPKIWSFSNAVDGLTKSLWEQAKAARAARVELLKQQEGEVTQRIMQAQSATTAGQARRLATGFSRIGQGDILGGLTDVGQASLDRLNNFFRGGKPAKEATQLIEDANTLRAELLRQIDELQSTPIGASDVPQQRRTTTAGGGKPKPSPKPRTPKGGTGPSAEDIERRYLDELDSLRSRLAAAESSMARNAEERAELELRQLEAAQRQTLRSLEADADYSDAQKERVRIAIEAVAAAEREAINFQRRAQEEQEAQSLTDERYRAAEEQLRLQYDLAKTEADRRAIALKILDAEDAYLRAKLQAVIASETASDVERERARVALASLEATAGPRREVVGQQHEGALGRYIRSASDPYARAEEAAARELQNVRDGLAEGLAEQFGMKNDFVRDMLAIFLDQVLFQPIAEALRGGLGGGGGILGSILGPLGALPASPRPGQPGFTAIGKFQHRSEQK